MSDINAVKRKRESKGEQEKKKRNIFYYQVMFGRQLNT